MYRVFFCVISAFLIFVTDDIKKGDLLFEVFFIKHVRVTVARLVAHT